MLIVGWFIIFGRTENGNTYNMEILALDPASKTGYATAENYGVWNCTPNTGESRGMRLIKFEKHLKSILDSLNIGVVSYELVAGKHTHANNIKSEMIGILLRECESRGIEYKGYAPTKIKKFATGKGNASKEDVINSVKEKYNYIGSDDNEADSIALYYLTAYDLFGFEN